MSICLPMLCPICQYSRLKDLLIIRSLIFWEKLHCCHDNQTLVFFLLLGTQGPSSCQISLRSGCKHFFLCSKKAYLRLPWERIRTFGPRELGLWVWPESYRTWTLESQFDTSPSTEKLRPQSLKWTGFLVGESPDHAFWVGNDAFGKLLFIILYNFVFCRCVKCGWKQTEELL